MTGPTTVVLFTCDLVHGVRRCGRSAGPVRRWCRCSWLTPPFPPAIWLPRTAGPSCAGRSPHDLRRSLRDRGGELFVRRGDSVEEVLKVVSESGAAGVVLTEDVGLFAQARQARLQRACAAQRWSFAVHPGSSVVPAGAVAPAGRGITAVFTPYWNRSQARHAPPSDGARPSSCRGFRQHWPRGPSRALRAEPGRPRLSAFQAEERAGRARWARWARRHLAAYGEGHDDLAADSTSRIGAYLHFGCLSPLEVDHGPHEPFVRQLCWRDFHRQVAFAFPELGQRDYRPRWAVAARPGRRLVLTATAARACP